MVLIKFLIWGQFLCLKIKCRVRIERLIGGKTSEGLAFLAHGDNPNNQITFSLTTKCLQSGVCLYLHGGTSSTNNKVTISGYFLDSKVITLFIFSHGVLKSFFISYLILSSWHINVSKSITSILFIFTRYLVRKLFRSSMVKRWWKVVASILTLLPSLNIWLSFILRASIRIRVFPVPALPYTNRQVFRLLSTGI